MNEYTFAVTMEIQFNLTVEAESEDEAQQLAEDQAHSEYLTAEPDSLMVNSCVLQD
jgi:hypothetical protein